MRQLQVCVPMMKKVNRILIILLIFLTLYLVKEIFLSSPNFITRRPPQKEKVDFLLTPKSHPFIGYEKELKKRNLFSLTTPSKNGKREIRPILRQKGSDTTLGLVGILSEKNGDVSIFKEKKKGELYFFREGEIVKGLKIISIGEGKVVVEYEGKKFELFL